MLKKSWSLNDSSSFFFSRMKNMAYNGRTNKRKENIKMKDELKKARAKKRHMDKTGTRMVANAGAIIWLYAIGTMSYTLGKKAAATATLIGIGGVLIGQIIDGMIVDRNIKCRT